MEEELRTLIAGLAGPGTTVDWAARPRGAALPGVVLTLVSDVSGHTHSGPDGLSEARVQVDVYAPTFAAAKRLARALRAGLDGHSDGVMGAVFFAMARDTVEEGETPDQRVYRSMLDFTVWHSVAQ